MTICDGRVAVVTGAGRGIGRAHALELARQGAKIVVNDLGASLDGSGASASPAQEVVDEIIAGGGAAIADHHDISDENGAAALIDAAVEHFGALDVLVNNAGNLRDRMLVNMAVDDWDAVIRVHLRGTFLTTRRAAQIWRQAAKSGQQPDARVINTTSSSGIYGNAGQGNYGAAKAGIAAFTIITAMELGRYGVTVNAIAPGAITRLSVDAIPAPQGDGFDIYDPANVSPLVAWLASPQSREVTGRVFNILGGHISVAEGWHEGPVADKDRRWEAAELGAVLPGLVRRSRGNADMSGRVPTP